MAGKWISVRVCLPPLHEEVITCSYANNNKHLVVTWGVFYGDQWCVAGHEHPIVTHWMRYPKTPTEV